MIYIGIDCGLDGAVAWCSNGGVFVQVTPTLKTGKGNKRGYDIQAMRRLLFKVYAIANADGLRTAVVMNVLGLPPLTVVERQQAYPNQGGVSNFTIGLGYGVWLGLLGGIGMAFQDVHPKTWQPIFGISSRTGDTKKQSIAMAKQLFPHVSLLRTPKCTTSHDGMSDALLLMEYARRLRSN